LPYRPKRAQPYLYSTKEIRALLRAALSLPVRGGLRPWTYHCLFGLLSVTGMRTGEAGNLELPDVDLRTGVLTIRSGKFGKSRLIPIHASTRRVLADYLARRKRWWATRPVSSYLIDLFSQCHVFVAHPLFHLFAIFDVSRRSKPPRNSPFSIQ
jgi:integrase/recombinase XerD